MSLYSTNEMHDRQIAATALVLASKGEIVQLLTCDQNITASGLVAKAAAVVQDAESYQKLIDRLELLESVAKIRQSINEFEQGEGMPLNQAFAEFKEKYAIPD
ncbi:hypothetical protein [Sphaerospermopsis sp. FACHB-1194]|uniref:hypothetical protein n=1 Tax=Sphaerospermopsis sp. FACHB-1194 TaxID=2692862 RepID=UPI001F556B46|nr:hypothetical protein [Sphaerospermopsis sp. FACHB-1194]